MRPTGSERAPLPTSDRAATAPIRPASDAGNGATGKRHPPAAAANNSAAATMATGKRATTLLADSTRTEQGLELTPWKGEFINYDVDTTYVMPFRVCNRSSEIQTLRFVAPTLQSQAFRLLNMSSVRLAPGLSHVLEVEFMTHAPRDYEDSFTILKGDGQSVTVPLTARMSPELEYAPAVDFGVVEQHRTIGTARPLRLVNRGGRDAVVTFGVTGERDRTAARADVAPPSPLGQRMVVVSPAATVAPSRGETTVMLELPRDVALGIHRWVVALTVDGQPAPRTVAVSVEVVDSRGRLLDRATGQETVRVSFAAKVFEGVKCRYPLQVVNGSTQGVSFAFQLANDTLATEPPPFRLVPEQGHLGPKEARDVAVVFEPPLRPVRTGWASQAQQELALTKAARTQRYEALFSLLFVETEQTLSFHVAGESCESVVAVSRSVLDFGVTRMDSVVSQEVELQNGVADLPLPYAFDSVANFRVSQPTGTVPPGGSVALTITFQPRRLGRFREMFTVAFNGGTVTRTITLVGHSVAPTASLERTVGTVAAARGAASIPAAEASAVDLPRAVDMGMVPGLGLRPPRLPVTAAELTQELHGGDDAALRSHTRTGGHVAPVNLSDTKALIKRTYADAPSSAMERRDCRRELLPMDLLKVALPIKTVDFGRITVGASATRSLFVFNGTDGSVLVTMPGEDDPHVTFSPRAQVVPASRMAHFEVTFTSGAVQTVVQQAIAFTVNSRYQSRFTVRAEVVPVEVVLSTAEVRLQFGAANEGYTTAPTSGHPVVQGHVIMTNSGSSPAPFRWSLPPQPRTPPYFAIQPTHGVLAPMAKATVEVIYAPPARDGTAEVTCEAVLSVDGALADRHLRLVGAVAPTKCVWGKVAQAAGNSNSNSNSNSAATSDEVTVDLKRIAAGKEVSIALPLLNRGKSSAFFSFESLPSDVTVAPSPQGRVGAGGSEELLLTLRVPRPGCVQHALVCNVRGMKKGLRVNLRAEVVAPPVIIAGPALARGEVLLDYAEVYAGAERVRGVRFANNGDVPAVIELDLRERHRPQLTQALADGDPLGPPPPSVEFRCLAEDVEVEENEPAELTGVPRVEVAVVMAKRRRADLGDPVADSSDYNEEGGEGESEAVPGLYQLTLPPLSESVARIAFAPNAASGRVDRRLYARWRQVGAEETHPLPSLVLQAAVLPPLLSLRLREDSAVGSPVASRPPPPLPVHSAAGDCAGSGTVHTTFPTVVAGRLPRPLHIELRNVSQTEAVAWRLRNSRVAAPLGSQPPSSSDKGGAVPLVPSDPSPPPPVAPGHRANQDSSSSSSSSPFLVEPASGALAAGSTDTVTVTFLANRVGSFRESYALIVDDDADKVCGRIAFTATATEPQLTCEQSTVVFPAVPLGVEVRQTVYLVNSGFDAIQVRHAAAGDGKGGGEGGEGRATTHSPVSVRFPQGNTLSLHVGRIPVEVVFCSKQPITLTSSILLTTDREGQDMVIHVRATAINSILATEGYVRHSNCAISNVDAEVGDGTATTAVGSHTQPFKLLERTGAAASAVASGEHMVDLGASSRSLPAQGHGGEQRGSDGGPAGATAAARLFGAIDAMERTRGGGRALDTLTAWLNGNMFARRTVPAGMLVELLQATYGGILSDAVEGLVGIRPKRIAPTAEGGSGAKKRTPQDGAGGGEAAAAAVGGKRKPATTAEAATLARGRKGLAALHTLIAFLKHYGCCLSAVYVPYLLSFEEYLSLRKEEEESARASPGPGPFPAPTTATASASRGKRTAAPPPKRGSAAEKDEGGTGAGATPSPEHALAEAVRSAAEFKVRAAHAWVTVVLEAIRVFYLFRFAPDMLARAVPPAYAAAFPLDVWTNAGVLSALSSSDVYSREEGSLLLWVEWVANQLCSCTGSPLAHGRCSGSGSSGDSLGERIFGPAVSEHQQEHHQHQQQRGETATKTSPVVQLHSFEDLRDVRPLIAAVLFYVPGTRPSFLDGDRKVVRDPTLRSDLEANAELLMQVLGELGIAAGTSATGASAATITSTTSGSSPAAAAAAAAAVATTRAATVGGGGGAAAAPTSWLPTGKGWVDGSQTDILLFTASLMSFLARFVGAPAGGGGVSVTVLAQPQPALDGATEVEHMSGAAASFVSGTGGPGATVTASLLFEGKLLSPITRTVQLYNPPTPTWVGARQYRVRLDNTAFSLDQRSITVGPGGYATLTLAYTPRHHRTDYGQCLLVDETPSLPPEERAPLTLNLTVKPTHEPSRVFEMEALLYEPLHTEIPVSNPFTTQDYCVVSVRVAQEYSGADSSGDSAGAPYPESEIGQRFQRAFFIPTEVLPLRRGEEAYLPVHFVPLARGTYTARLTFREDREGEFSFLVIVRCVAPRPGSSGDTPPTGIDIRAELEEVSPHSLPIRPSNTALDRALRFYEERSRQQQQQQQSQVGAAGRTPAPTMPSLGGNTYRVSFVNAQWEGPNPFFALSDDDRRGEGDGLLVLPADGTPGELRFVFKPKYVGTYRGYIVLESALDTRLLPFTGECVPCGEQRQLRFACPARQHITQNITLVNSTSEDWLVTATFDESGGGGGGGGVTSFRGPREVRVLQGRRKEYPLTYSPAWQTPEGEGERGRLVLYNKTTGQRHTYELVGEAAPPLSEDVIYVDCRAREKRIVTLTVPNILPTDCTYHVDVGVPFTDAEPTVTIPRGSFARFALNLAPTAGGNYTGKIVFRTPPRQQQQGSRGTSHNSNDNKDGRPSHQDPSPDGRYVWFLVHLSVTPPEKEGTVVLDTDMRTPVVADVAITNPLDRPLTFAVHRFGAGLAGANRFSLAARATAVYPCTFTPSLIGTFEGRLSFFNDDVGEYWYEVKMNVVDSPAEEVRFEAPLGSPTSATVRLANRSGQDCQLMVQNTNTVNFVVSPAVVSIPAGEVALVQITYTPTAVGAEQTALLTFSHAVLGHWRYACSGIGTPPEDSTPRTVSCELGATATVSLPLVNTLDVDTPLAVTVKAANANAARCFAVQRAPAADYLVPAGGRATAVLAYQPRSVGHHEAVVEVRPLAAAQSPRYDVCWRFAVKGQAEWRDSLSPPLRLRCAARKQLEDTIELRAPGLTAEDRRGATITFHPDIPRGSTGAGSTTTATSGFDYALVGLDTADDAASEEGVPPGAAVSGTAQEEMAAFTELPPSQQVFRVHVRFTPLRPVAVSGDLVIHGGGAATTGGGVWRYRVFLEAPPAPIDDTITIASALHVSTSVVFDLYNVFPYKSNFAAYFTPDSSKDLTVSPAHGLLLPFVTGQRGAGAAAMATPIKVSFKPSLRVPQVEGTLVVDTEDMRWSFRVVGKLESQTRRRPPQ